MISKLTAIIMTIISIVSSVSAQLPAKAATYYNVAYGTEERQVMDVFFPEEHKEKMGVVLYVHGGGWVSGSKSDLNSMAKKLSGKAGCITASINYRYVSKSIDCDDILDDINSALSKIKSMAETRGMICNKVMLVGYSAGAHLSLMYAYTKKNTSSVKPVAVVSMSGPTDLSDEKFISGNLFDTNDSSKYNIIGNLIGETLTSSNYKSKKSILLEYSPITHVSASSVPTIVIHGSKDNTVDISHAKALVKKLKANGITYKFYELPNSGHALNKDKSVYNESQEMILKYAQKYVVG